MKHFSTETLSCSKWTFVNLLLRQVVQKRPVLIHQSFLHQWVSLSSCRIILIPNRSVETLVCTNLLKVTLNPLPSITTRSGQPAARTIISWWINKCSSRVSLSENCPCEPGESRELWQKWTFRPEAEVHPFLGSHNLRQWGVTLKHHNSEEEKKQFPTSSVDHEKVMNGCPWTNQQVHQKQPRPANPRRVCPSELRLHI